MYDSYRDTGITGGCSQRNTESVRYEHLETPLCTYLNKSTATVTTHLKRNKDTHTQLFTHRNRVVVRDLAEGHGKGGGERTGKTGGSIIHFQTSP